MSDELKSVPMPLMGEGVNEATLIKWLKSPGDKVEKDEALLEVSTDKVDTEITSPHSGFLIKTYAEAEDTIYVDATIAFISDNKDAKAPAKVEDPSGAGATSAPATANTSSGGATAGSPPQQFQVQTGELRTSPLVRKMAQDMNLNLAAIAGRGLNGRITKKDVLNFTEKLQLGAQPQHSNEPVRLKTELKGGKEFLEGAEVRREKMSKMRKLIAEHMIQSVQTSPHVTTTFEIDMSRIVELRAKHKESVIEKHGVKLTFTHFLTHATILAIKKNPVVNVSVDGTDILWKDDINMGIAVAVESGLIVPVIKKANDMSLIDVTKAATDLVTRARSKKLNPEDVQGGSFSITNPGIFGSLSSAAIISQPQVAILNVGTIIERPVVIKGDITIRPLIHIGLTFDHRVVDGEGGARFLADLKQIIENYDEKLP